jgi:uncharacterized protein
MKTLTLIAIFFCVQIAAVAQNIQVNKQNKTIAVTADQTVSVDAEIAMLHIGYHNYGATQDSAFRENARVANTITKALLDAHVSRENIETEKLRLEHVNPRQDWTSEMKADRQFEAEQSWKITVSVADAQAVMNLAAQNGANDVSDTDWNVADPLALEAKVSGAALAKARAIAEQMAKALNAKLGDLVYASNQAPPTEPQFMPFVRNGFGVGQGGGVFHSEEPQFTLFPQKVHREATVYAVFAIE